MKQSCGNTRFLWNYFLSKQKEKYKKEKKFIFYNEMASYLSDMKKEREWLNESYSQVLQQTLRDLDQALKNCFRSNFGFPKYKSKYSLRDSFRYVQHVTLQGTKRVRLPKIGDVKISLHRKLPNHTSATILQKGNKWYISFVVEVSEPRTQEQPKQEIKKIIGVDLNSSHTALSTSELISNPKPAKAKRKQIVARQRKLSRTKKKSRNRYKIQLKLFQTWSRVNNIRNNFLHQISNRIAKDCELVCVETLDIEKMKQNHLSAKAIQDAGWASFISMLDYKCQLKGSQMIKINQYLPSSKTCSSCNHIKSELDLKTRTFKCGHLL